MGEFAEIFRRHVEGIGGLWGKLIVIITIRKIFSTWV
jgi:hypothetical protein